MRLVAVTPTRSGGYVELEVELADGEDPAEAAARVSAQLAVTPIPGVDTDRAFTWRVTDDERAD